LNKISIKGHKLTAQMVAPFDQSRSAAILAENRMVGVIGEFNTEVSRDFKLPQSCAGFELFISALQNTPPVRYRPLNRYPELEQDFCLRASSELTYAELTQFMAKQLEKAAKEHGYIYDLAPLDIYQRETDKGYKQTTWRIKLAHPDRTLTTDESNQLLDKIAGAARKALRAERV
jgi:phenylalanyl-tRNA synthetase beta subunit